MKTNGDCLFGASVGFDFRASSAPVCLFDLASVFNDRFALLTSGCALRWRQLLSDRKGGKILVEVTTPSRSAFCATEPR